MPELLLLVLVVVVDVAREIVCDFDSVVVCDDIDDEFKISCKLVTDVGKLYDGSDKSSSSIYPISLSLL